MKILKLCSLRCNSKISREPYIRGNVGNIYSYQEIVSGI